MQRSNPHASSEQVRLEGHIIDSLVLPKVLDEIIAYGGRHEISDVRIGHSRTDPSSILITVWADGEEKLREIVERIGQHGAAPVDTDDCQSVAADMDGAFPESFYSTTNLATRIRLDGRWLTVERQEMDCGILLDAENARAQCVPMTHVRRGDSIVVGHRGVRVVLPSTREESDRFSFMSSAVSTEKPKRYVVERIAAEMKAARGRGERILFVGGPAIVHSGSAPYVASMIRNGYVQVLFAGNALAAHDVESALYGTSLGVHLNCGSPAEKGHEHHLRAINTIRRCGGIKRAVAQGVLCEGIMYECVQQGIEFLLAGSIRDDGPLPEVITDVLEAQDRMREAVADVDYCLMVATALHSIAVGNLLPARVRTVCADINPGTVTKLADRGTMQSFGVVTDVEPFLRALAQELFAASGEGEATAQRSTLGMGEQSSC